MTVGDLQRIFIDGLVVNCSGPLVSVTDLFLPDFSRLIRKCDWELRSSSFTSSTLFWEDVSRIRYSLGKKGKRKKRLSALLNGTRPYTRLTKSRAGGQDQIKVKKTNDELTGNR